MIEELTKENVNKILSFQKWIFAKTMPRNPHWYTLKTTWINPLLFENIIDYIRRNSYIEYFHGKAYQMYVAGSYKYWTMGNPIEKTILINRAKV